MPFFMQGHDTRTEEILYLTLVLAIIGISTFFFQSEFFAVNKYFYEIISITMFFLWGSILSKGLVYYYKNLSKERKEFLEKVSKITLLTALLMQGATWINFVVQNIFVYYGILPIV